MAKKPQNLLLVTEHYPCSNQESFLETELPYLTKFFNVYLVTRETDKRMYRILPPGVIFSRPSTKSGRLKKWWLRTLCRFSHAYRIERRQGQEEGRWNHNQAAHTLDALVDSELMRRYVLSLPLMQDERPLVIYSANFNNYLYGLTRIKEMGKDIHVTARCHRANMFDPQTGERRETLNYITNRNLDAVYFTTEERRNTYVHHFTDGEFPGKYRVAPLGVPGPEVLLEPPEEDYLLRIVTCSPIEEDKRLTLLIDAIAGMKIGCLDWVHIGDGSQREKVLEYARDKLENKPGIRYEFLGDMNQEERYHYYASHKLDVFLSVSSSESVPTMMLEAMANHIFVCATAVDGVTDVVSNETGLLMPENPTLEQLTAFLEMLCNMDKDKFDSRAELGYQCWEEWFNAEENCMKFASELSAVENIQIDENPEPVHRVFTSWKPEEKVEVIQSEEEEDAAAPADETPQSADSAAGEEKAEKQPESQTDAEKSSPDEKPAENAETAETNDKAEDKDKEQTGEKPEEKAGESEKKKKKPSGEETEKAADKQASDKEDDPSKQQAEEKPIEQEAEELIEMMEKMAS